MMDALKDIAKYAGQLITGRYFRQDAQAPKWKPDSTPLTLADIASHNYLTSALSKQFSYPVISEEDLKQGNLPPGTDFWLVDPLDGSQGFIEGSGDFCINIALIQGGEPVVGVIYAPVYDEMYWAEKGKGAWMERGRLKIALPNQKLQGSVLVRSRHYDHQNVDRFIQANAIETHVKVGAALKFAHLASGRATHYPRYTGSREWDTAAGHILLIESGGSMVDLKTGDSPAYNKPEFRNNAFLACAHSIPFDRLKVDF